MATNDVINEASQVLRRKARRAEAAAAPGEPGRPVRSSVQVANRALSAEYPALREEVTAAHPVTELSSEVRSLIAKAGQVASDQLSGILSPDVQKQIERISSENALKAGLGMASPAARNLVARDLGLTSLDLQKAGMESAKALMDFEGNLQAQRLDYLTKMRAADLDATQLRVQARQFESELGLKRLALLSENIANYYRTAFSYEARKKSSQKNLSDYMTSLRDVNNQLRGQSGVRKV